MASKPRPVGSASLVAVPLSVARGVAFPVAPDAYVVTEFEFALATNSRPL